LREDDSKTFPKQSDRKTGILKLIRLMRIQSNGKANYFIIFIDNYSKWFEVHFLKQKSDTFKEFKDYKALVENQKEKRIKFFNEIIIEYINVEFSDFLAKNDSSR